MPRSIMMLALMHYSAFVFATALATATALTLFVVYSGIIGNWAVTSFGGFFLLVVGGAGVAALGAALLPLSIYSFLSTSSYGAEGFALPQGYDGFSIFFAAPGMFVLLVVALTWLTQRKQYDFARHYMFATVLASTGPVAAVMFSKLVVS
ncbi:MAG: hypothetical protein AAFV19_21535 [Pseudomonadota bacterium]